jgi:hypothetical protein
VGEVPLRASTSKLGLALSNLPPVGWARQATEDGPAPLCCWALPLPEDVFLEGPPGWTAAQELLVEGVETTGSLRRACWCCWTGEEDRALLAAAGGCCCATASSTNGNLDRRNGDGACATANGGTETNTSHSTPSLRQMRVMVV